MGLATARAVLMRKGNTFSVAVLESSKRLGSGISERSSGVIHAGIYYDTGSLKARMCVRGRKLLYDFCVERNVRHLRRGKLLVATSEEQMRQLMGIKARSIQNGIVDPSEVLVELTSSREVRALEPSLKYDNIRGALFSPSTGVIDVPGYVDALRVDVEERGGIIVTSCRVRGGEASASATATRTTTDILVDTDTGGTIACKYLINCTGLSSPLVAASIKTPHPDSHEANVPVPFYARGHYYKLTRIPAASTSLNHLVYPLPERHGLGVHATVDVDGEVRFGPDVLFVEKRLEESEEAFHRRLISPPSLEEDERLRRSFYEAIRRYYEPPGFSPDRLHFDYAGVRPKLGDASSPARDFFVWGPESHRVPGLIHCLGVESPGLTSSLALGEWVVGRYLG